MALGFSVPGSKFPIQGFFNPEPGTVNPEPVNGYIFFVYTEDQRAIIVSARDMTIMERKKYVR